MIEGQDQRVILGDNTQKRETCGINGIVDGGVERAEKLLPHAVYHKVEPACGEGPELGNGVLGVPQGGGVGACHYHGSVRAADGQLKAETKTGGSVHKAEVEFFLQRLHKAFHAGGVCILLTQSYGSGEEVEVADSKGYEASGADSCFE